MEHKDTKTQRHEERVFEKLDEETERVARGIVNAAYTVHTTLGPGLLENVYELCFVRELELRGLDVQRQVLLPIRYADLEIPNGLRLDILVNNRVIVELKAVEMIMPVHRAQVFTYVKLSNRRLGFVINFNMKLIR